MDAETKEVVQNVVLIAVSIFVLLSNSLVVIAVKTNYRLNHPHYHLLASLAIADIIVGFLIPVRVFFHIHFPGVWLYGEGLCSLLWWVNFTVTASSKFHLLAITIDRYMCLSSSALQAYVTSPGRVKLMISLSWMGGMLAYAPVHIFRQDVQMMTSKHHVCMFSFDWRGVVPSQIFSFWLPLLITAVLQVQMFKFAKKHIKAHEVIQLQNNSSSRSFSSRKSEVADLAAVRIMQVRRRRERKAAMTCTIITVAFAVCWAPVFTILTVQSFCQPCRIPLAKALSIAGFLGLINSAINPIVYTVFTTEMREAFKLLILKPFRCCASFN